MAADGARIIALADVVDDDSIGDRANAFGVVLRLLLARRLDLDDVLLRAPVRHVFARDGDIVIADPSSDEGQQDDAAVHAVYRLPLPCIERRLVQPCRNRRMLLVARKRMVELRILLQHRKEVAAECDGFAEGLLLLEDPLAHPLELRPREVPEPCGIASLEVLLDRGVDGDVEAVLLHLLDVRLRHHQLIGSDEIDLHAVEDPESVHL